MEESLYLGVVQFGTEAIHSNGANVTFQADGFKAALKQGKPNIDWSKASLGKQIPLYMAWILLIPFLCLLI